MSTEPVIHSTTRKVLPQNRISHRQGHANVKGHVHMLVNGKPQKVDRRKADDLAAEGAKFISNSKYKELTLGKTVEDVQTIEAPKPVKKSAKKK